MMQLSNQALPPAACTKGEESKPVCSWDGTEVLAGLLAIALPRPAVYNSPSCAFPVQQWDINSIASHKDSQSTFYLHIPRIANVCLKATLLQSMQATEFYPKQSHFLDTLKL